MSSMTDKVYWKLIQGELRCATCTHLIKENLHKTVPCDKYTEWEGTMDCPFRELNMDKVSLEGVK